MVDHFRPHNQCKSCALIFKEIGDGPVTTSALYRKFQKVIKGGVPLRDIQRDLIAAGTPISYDSLRGHLRKHQDARAYPIDARIKNPGRKLAHLVERKTDEIVAEAAERNMHHTSRRSAILDDLYQKMENGELKGATYTAIANLLKQEADIEAKQTDQAIEMQKLINTFVGNPLPLSMIPTLSIQEGEVIESDTTPSPQ